MERKKLKVHVGWSGNNFCCELSEDIGGIVVVTAKTLSKLKEDFEESLCWHIEGCLADGDALPAYITEGNYDIDYELDTAAMLREAERFTTLAAISRATGINQKLLSHYANMLKIPRPAQRQRIVDGLHAIGRQFLAVQ
ncbi:MAG: helix-turn-helix domain-containing protein [Muribaculaceae bacterium]|nr:helix-turn-helix domain-containing protein [Muribaculaceae bacterium]